MTGEQIIFFIVATFTVLAALGMVSVASVFHAALLMILTFLGIGVLYMTMGAGFLGLIQILIYVGAIAVLVLFAIMLTPRVMQREGQPRYTSQWPVAALLASGLLVVLSPQLVRAPWPVIEPTAGVREYAIEIGVAFMDPGLQGYLLPFEVASILLLVALVGSIAIAREET